MGHIDRTNGVLVAMVEACDEKHVLKAWAGSMFVCFEHAFCVLCTLKQRVAAVNVGSLAVLDPVANATGMSKCLMM